MKITASTRKFGIIGYPLGHTFSPAMHNAAFEALDINAVYLAFPVRHILQLKHSIRQFQIEGLSVTIPHKIRIRRLIDKMDPLALQIGSVNTVLLRNNLLEGYNTDGAGAVRAVEEEFGRIEKKNVLIIGSGGSARAIAFSLLEKNPRRIGILARNRRAALQLARNLRLKKKGPELEVLMYPEGGTRRILPQQRIPQAVLASAEQTAGYDLFIQTTPMGMKGHPSERNLPLTAEFLHSRQCVFDIVYNPQITPFLNLARKKKMQTISGYKMLLYQGALQFSLFTGREAPVSVMENALLKELNLK